MPKKTTAAPQLRNIKLARSPNDRCIDFRPGGCCFQWFIEYNRCAPVQHHRKAKKTNRQQCIFDKMHYWSPKTDVISAACNCDFGHRYLESHRWNDRFWRKADISPASSKALILLK
ncbi:MAG TPA: hypothetical protein VNW15_15225 [Rhizomicrobium sp.]|nr:hypothetical protein [Rhizomicrobium sp.]